MKEIDELPYYENLTNSTSFFYRMREWLGEGYDVIMCWKDSDNRCYYFQSFMGETAEKKDASIIHGSIDLKKFEEILQGLKKNGILELKMDENPKILNNYNDFYFVSFDGGNYNSFCLLHGYHGDYRFKKIQKIINDKIILI